MITDPANPIVPTVNDFRAIGPDVEIKIGVYDLLDCLTELRAGRLDIAIAGIALDEVIPHDVETFPLYEEDSGLFCAPDHPCAQQPDAAALRASLAAANISTYSFLNNPIGHNLDVDLLDRDAEVPQDTIEATDYRALCGRLVGLIPNHFADRWVQSGARI